MEENKMHKECCDDKSHKDCCDKDKMAEEWFKNKISEKCKGNSKSKMNKTGAGANAGIYCLGFIGAVVYYIGTATSFWIGVLGFLKALVWPAFLVYGILKYIGA